MSPVTPIDHVDRACARAAAAQPQWAARAVDERAACLESVAQRLEDQQELFAALAVREAGKSLLCAHDEVADAIDLCRDIAALAREMFAPVALPGPTGETNELRLVPRGVFACVCSWKVPLGTFLGQIAAALVAGNTVLVRPAPHMPLTAAATVRLAMQAGIPADCLALLPNADADADFVGAALIGDARLSGVAFAGSNAAACQIAGALLQEGRPIRPVISPIEGGVHRVVGGPQYLLQFITERVFTVNTAAAGGDVALLRLSL